MTEEDEGLVQRLRRTVCHGSLRCERLGVDDQAADRIEAQAAEIERLRVEAQAQFDRGYYDGCANPIVRYDALREALVDLLHAVCGKTGFAEAVRRDSGRIYPWPALDLAEAKAIAALEKSK